MTSSRTSTKSPGRRSERGRQTEAWRDDLAHDGTTRGTPPNPTSHGESMLTASQIRHSFVGWCVRKALHVLYRARIRRVSPSITISQAASICGSTRRARWTSRAASIACSAAQDVLKSNRDMLILFESEADWCALAGCTQQDMFDLLAAHGIRLFAWDNRSKRWTTDRHSLLKAGMVWPAATSRGSPACSANPHAKPVCPGPKFTTVSTQR